MSKNLLYENVASKIESQIKRGVLLAGDRVPSVRVMSETEGVSRSTIVQAYIHLENLGLIEARPQSGFFVKPLAVDEIATIDVKKCKTSAVEVTIPSIVSSVFASTRDKSNVLLGAACPDPQLLPTLKLNRISHKLIRENPDHTAEYGFPPGHEKLRKQIAKLSAKAGIKTAYDQIITTTGAMEALVLALRVCTKPGDSVMIESPTYYGTLLAIEKLGLKAVEVPCSANDGLDLTEVERVLKNQKIDAGLFVVNFSNPMGSVMSDTNKQKLVELFSKNQIPLIEDDIYGDLQFNGPRPKALKSFDNDGWVITCSSFSKTLAPGLHVGWIIPSSRFYEQVENAKFTLTVSTPNLPQMIIAEYLSSGSYDRHIRQLRKLFYLQTQKMIQSICQHFPKETKVSHPKGGFVLWVELPPKVDSVNLHLKALENKICISPGVIFSARGQYKNFIRINCGLMWSKQIEKAIQTLGQLM